MPEYVRICGATVTGQDAREILLFQNFLQAVDSGPHTWQQDPAAKRRCLEWIAQDPEARLQWLGISGDDAAAYRQAIAALGEE